MHITSFVKLKQSLQLKAPEMLIRAFAAPPPPSTAAPPPSSPLIQHVNPSKLNNRKNRNKLFTSSTSITLRNTHTSCSTSSLFTTHSDGCEFEFRVEDEDDNDADCPWQGAVMYKRNAAVSHLEYCTTLERLGLGKLSSEVSKSRASQMGLRVVKSVKEYPDGTPVLISVEVIRKKQRLRLDGIVRTVISLNCNRCGEPASQSVYSNLSILLREEPIEEPEIINLGVMFGEDKSRNFGDGDEEDSLIDLDDQLYFPVDQKVIDISKNIRDLIHIEITLTAVCDPNCKGLCLKCGTNLNTSKCTCRTYDVAEKSYGPLGNLKEQMQQS